MAGLWFSYSNEDYELLLRENLKLQEDKYSLQTELDLCYTNRDRYRIKIEKLKAELDYKEDKYCLKSNYDDEVQRNEVLRQELVRKSNQIQSAREEFKANQNEVNNLEKEVDNLKQKLNWQEDTVARYKKELSKYIYEKEYQIFELEDQLKYVKNQLQKAESKLNKRRNERDLQLISQKERVHYLEKEVKSLNLQIKKLKNTEFENGEKNEHKKPLTERPEQRLRQALMKLEKRDCELLETKSERDREMHTKHKLERKAELDDKIILHLRQKIEHIEREDNYKTLKLQSQRDKPQNERTEDRERIKVSEFETLKEREDRISVMRNQSQTLSPLYKTKASHDDKQNEEHIQLLARRKLERKIESDGMRIKELEERIEIMSSHELNIKHLKREIERRGQTIKDLRDVLESAQKQSSSTTELQRDLKEKETQIYELTDQLQSTLAKLKMTECRLNEIESERDLHQCILQDVHVDRKTRNDVVGFKSLKNTNEQIINLLELKIQRLEREIEQRNETLDCQKTAGECRELEAEKESELIRDLKKQDLLSKDSNQLKHALAKMKETEAKLHESTDQERRTRQELERKTRENGSRIKRLKQANDKIVMSQKQRIENLERDIEHRDLKLRSLEELLDNKKIKSINDRQIINNVRENEDQLFDQRDQLQQTLIQLKEMEAKLKETTSERDLERQARQDLERRAKENQAKVKELEQVKDKIVTPKNQRIQYLEGEVERHEMKVKELEYMLDETKAEVKSGKELGDILKKRENRLAELESHLKQTLVKLKETETELEETKTRLSKAMGDRLTDNNPNIANLSDKNRPVKLAERYTELYDNQWTDAFDIVGKYFDREQRTIEALLEILQDVMRFCIANGSKQMEDLQRVLGFSSTYEGDVPTDVRKYLKDSRKAMASIPVRNLYEIYIAHLKRSASKTLGRTLEVQSYVQECLEICWLMVIQDPPVVFAPVATSGSALNADIFKPYTSSGTHVEYTVWPALLLHEGGPVLAKGVAQGYGKKSRTSVLSQQENPEN